LNLILEFAGVTVYEGAARPHITETRNGEIFLCHIEGYYRYDESSNQMRRFIEADSLTVIDFEPESETYYVGSSDQGLLRYDRSGNLIARYDKPQGLSDSYVHSIEPISRNEIWIGTNYGLCRLNPDENNIKQFYQSDGLQGNQHYEYASHESRDGYLYFGGTNGLSKFDPKRLTTNTLLPRVYIDQISQFGLPLSFKGPDALVDAHPQALEELTQSL